MNRIGFVDAIRGLLILYIVVVIHGLFWLNLLPQAVSSLLLFVMPAIFVVSGYSYALFERSSFAQNGNRLTTKKYFSFLLARFTRILAPYFVYAISCIVLISVMPLIQESPRYALVDLSLTWLDPFRFGGNLTVGTLNWHLWFIPVFLLVTAAMPLATKLKPVKNPSIWLLLIIVTIIEFFLSKVQFPSEHLIKEAVYYLLFALLGYYLANSHEYFSRVNFGTVAGFSAVTLITIAFLSNDWRVMNMQKNEFPPNHLFFVFSCFWLAFFLFIFSKTPWGSQSGEKLAHSWWLKPFIRYGYSIYLWQGIGYTIAILIGRKLSLPDLVVWLLAVSMTITFGLLASSAEKIKLRLPVS